MTDRQKERNCQSNRQTKRVKPKRLREKENKILPTANFERNELRERDGVGWEGVEGERKKNELVTTKWLILRQGREKDREKYD